MANKLQDKLEALSKVRKYWRELANGVGDSNGSAVVLGLTSRIKSKADQLTAELKVCDPKIDVGIAGIQFGLKVLEDILLDFDINTCNKQIADLDAQIRAIADEVTKKAEKKKNPGIGGFENLIKKQGSK